jgi:multidrug transporter EmrE-like cation transporter
LLSQVLLQPAFLLGVTCFALALVAYSFALTQVELSIGYPVMMSVGLVIVVVYSALVFGEQVSGFRILGLVLVMLGIAVLFGSDARGRPADAAPDIEATR